MSEQGIAERLRRCVTDFRNGHSGEWGGSVVDLMNEAAEEVDRLRGELDRWIAFRQGDTAVIERLQAFLDTMKSDAGTREEAIYDRIKERERAAIRAGWIAHKRRIGEPWGFSISAETEDTWIDAAYLAHSERKDH
jgi:hypothetical protein